MVMHHMGEAWSTKSPCGREPASVYSGVMGHGYSTDWADVDCPACLEVKRGQMKTFYVSFGVMYGREPHPYWPGAHPDGYLEVRAPYEEQARALVQTFIGTKWGHMYDRKPEWAKRGRLAAVLSDGTIWQVEGVEPPTPKFTTSSPEYYGHDSTEVVACRIEGELLENSDQDALDNLGYEVEMVHKGCLTGGLAMFREVTDVDSRVQAGELDWAQPYHCEVCQESIT